MPTTKESTTPINEFIAKLIPKLVEKIRANLINETKIISEFSVAVNDALSRILHPDKKETTLTVESGLIRLSSKKIAGFLGLPPDNLAALLVALKSRNIDYSFELKSLSRLIGEELYLFNNREPELLSKIRQEETLQAQNCLKEYVKFDLRKEDNETSFDIIIRSEKAIYQLPGGYDLYAKYKWIPPQEFIEAIMEGGNFHVTSRECKGAGGYINNIRVSDETMEKIARNTKASRYPLDYASSHDLNGYPVFNIGYLFGIRSLSGKEAIIDSHGFEPTIQQGQGTFANCGDISWQNQIVTDAFWKRVALLADQITDKKQTCRSLKKVIPPVYVNLVKHNLTPSRIEITPLDILTPINSFEFKSNVSKQPLPSTIAHILRCVTGAQAVEALTPKKGTLIEFKFKGVKSFSDAYDTIIDKFTAYGHEKIGFSGNYHKCDFNEKQQVFTLSILEEFQGLYNKNNSTSFSLPDLEVEFGKQGVITPAVQRVAHYSLSYSSYAELEGALATLLTQRIIDVWSVIIQGYSIYLTRQPNENNLQQLFNRANSEQLYLATSETNAPVELPVANIKKETGKGFNHGDSEEGLQSLTHFFSEIMPDSCLEMFRITPLDNEIKIHFATEDNDSIKMARRNQFVTQVLLAIKMIVRWSNVETRLEVGQKYINPNYKRWSDVKKGNKDEVALFLPSSSVAYFNQALFNFEENGRLLAYLYSCFDLIGSLSHPVEVDNSQALVISTQKQEIIAATTSANALIVRKNFFAKGHETLFYNAVLAGNVELVRSLITEGYMSDAVVLKAVEQGHLEILELLLDHGANANAKTNLFGYVHGSALHTAVEKNNYAAAQMLLQKGALSQRFHYFYYSPTETIYATPLVLAVRQQNIDIVKFLSGRPVATIYVADFRKKSRLLRQVLKNEHSILQEKISDALYGGIGPKTDWASTFEELKTLLIKIVEQENVELTTPLDKLAEELHRLCYLRELDAIVELKTIISKEIATVLLNNPHVSSEMLKETDYKGLNLLTRAIKHGQAAFVEVLLDSNLFHPSLLIAGYNKKGREATALAHKALGRDNELFKRIRTMHFNYLAVYSTPSELESMVDSEEWSVDKDEAAEALNNPYLTEEGATLLMRVIKRKNTTAFIEALFEGKSFQSVLLETTNKKGESALELLLNLYGLSSSLYQQAEQMITPSEENNSTSNTQESSVAYKHGENKVCLFSTATPATRANEQLTSQLKNRNCKLILPLLKR